MADLFILALIGHLIGDYLLQPKKMALGKSRPNWRGSILCTLHVVIYTVAVALLIGTKDPLVWALIFVPHWVIDRWSLGTYWLKLIKGRTYESVSKSDMEKDFDVAFTALVYTVVDNSWHLISLLLVIKYLIL